MNQGVDDADGSVHHEAQRAEAVSRAGLPLPPPGPKTCFLQLHFVEFHINEIIQYACMFGLTYSARPDCWLCPAAARISSPIAEPHPWCSGSWCVDPSPGGILESWFGAAVTMAGHVSYARLLILCLCTPGSGMAGHRGRV